MELAARLLGGLLALGLAALVVLPSKASGFVVTMAPSSSSRSAAGSLLTMVAEPHRPSILSRRSALGKAIKAGAVLACTGSLQLPAAASAAEEKVAVFSGGCFWCLESPFDKKNGVTATISGYTGGNEKQPTYKQVSAGVTGHAESVEVKYDPSKITYEELLDVFWHQINPTQVNRQFCDGGKQYRSAIWYANDAERQAAEASKAKFAESGVFGTRNLVTEISPLKTFWPAEDYHQNYYIEQPMTYKYYRSLCGRDQYLDSIWGPGNH